MANEVSISISNTLVNGPLKDQPQARSFKQDQTVRAMHKVTALATLADLAVPVGTITDAGWMIIENLDLTNFVTVGPEDAAAMIPYQKINPGETHALRLDPAAVIRWQADTAQVECLITIYQN